MSRTCGELPEYLLGGAHERWVLLAAGVSAWELRGPHWSRDHRGLWYWADARADGVARARRARDLVPAGGAIGGWAAGVLLGATDLDGETPAGEPLPVPVCCGRQQTCRRREGVALWRSDLHPGEVIDVDGVPVTSPERTCFDLARFSSGLVAGVVAVEALLRAVPVDPAAVAELVHRRRRWRGRPQARTVLELADGRTRSPGESRLRLMWILDAGLPRPLVNAKVTAQDGFLLGEVDLLDVASGLVGEYDGAVHAGAAARARDHAREEQLERAGLRVVRVTSVDLAEHHGRTIWRLRQARAAGLSRDRSVDRWSVAAPG